MFCHEHGPIASSILNRRRSTGCRLGLCSVYNLSLSSFLLLRFEFEISDGVILPVGEYQFQDVGVVYVLGAQRLLPSTTTSRMGSFFSGDGTKR